MKEIRREDTDAVYDYLKTEINGISSEKKHVMYQPLEKIFLSISSEIKLFRTRVMRVLDNKI